MRTPPRSQRYLLWIAIVTASMAVAMAVLLVLLVIQERAIRLAAGRARPLQRQA